MSEVSADYYTGTLSELPQHVYHHYDDQGAKVSVKVEHNSRGNNWEASVTGAKSVSEAMRLLIEAENELRATFGEKASE